MDYFPVYKVSYLKPDGSEKTYEFSSPFIHLDDSILDIKLKIIDKLKTDNMLVTVNELYLFVETRVLLDPDLIYEIVTNKDSVTLKEGCLNCFLKNISAIKKNGSITPSYELPSQEEYDIDDIINLNIDKEVFFQRRLGQQEMFTNSQFVCNPLNFTSDHLVVPNETNYDSNLLLDSGNINDNTIFVCLASDVLFNNSRVNNVDDYITQYFPLLLNANIKTVEDLDKYRRLPPTINKTHEQGKVDLLFDIKKQHPTKLHFITPWGIKFIKLTIKQIIEQTVPLGIIFKNTRSTSSIPLIKFSPELDKDSIYRLFCEKKAANGMLIPAIESIESIRELSKLEKTITFYNGEELTCVFNERGDMVVTCDFKNSIKSVDEVQEICNTIVSHIRSSTLNLGFRVGSFLTLFEDNIKIETLTYACEIQSDYTVSTDKLVPFLNCIKNEIIDDESDNATRFVYKRVSKKNDGFNTTIAWKNSSNNIEVNIENINNIRYLLTIPVYVESIILMAQNKLSEDMLMKITKMCEFKETETKTETEMRVPYSKKITSSIKTLVDENNSDTEEEEEEEGKQDDLHKTVMNIPKVDVEENDSDMEKEEEEQDSPLIQENKSSTQEYDTKKSPLLNLEEREDDMLYEQMKGGYDTETVKTKDTLMNEDDNEEDNEEEYSDNEEDDENVTFSHDSIVKPKIIMNPNYFSNRIIDHDPEILIEPNSKRKCGQPVLVTDSELEVIQKTNPLKKDDILKVDSNTNNNYICPMYWCPKLNISLPPEEIKTEIVNGVKKLTHPLCGKIIKKHESLDENGLGIIKLNVNRDKYPTKKQCKEGNICVPCCSLKDADLKDAPLKALESLNPRDIPIPNEVKNLFGLKPTDNELVLFETQDTSFLGSISSALSNNMTVQDLKNLILSSVTVDDFIKYQNGNLVTDFQESLENLNKHDSNITDNVAKYKNTKLFKKINMDDIAEKLYYKQVISAYTNFIEFIKDNTLSIDYTYLWDILCLPNNKLFKNGLNLIILVYNKTENITQMICPTNHYSSSFYDSRKDNLFLFKTEKEEQYNPICYNTTTGQEMLFSESRPIVSIQHMLNTFVKPQIEKCRAHSSSKSDFDITPTILSNLVANLEEIGYRVRNQILNYNNKVIGVTATDRKDKTGFVPCVPSGLMFNTSYDFVFVSYDPLWSSYNDTVQFLTQVSESSKRKIKCRPISRVTQLSSTVVGILTESNQFVQLSAPLKLEDAPSDTLTNVFTETDFVDLTNDSNKLISSDKNIFSQDSKDNEREDYINRIRAENNFYFTFKNTVRLLFANNENQKWKKETQLLLSQKDIIYQDKLIKVEQMLREMVKRKVQFIGDDSYYKLIKTITACILKDSESSCSLSTGLCGFTDGNCNLIVPRFNLVSGRKKNDNIYFKRLSDELIRNNRIRAYIFSKQTTEGLEHSSYSLDENEIILTDSTIESYFKQLVPLKVTNRVSFTSFDEAVPSQPLFQQCKPITQSISDLTWVSYFPKGNTESVYSNTIPCSFDFITRILHTKNPELSKIDIKKQLVEEYLKYSVDYEDTIRAILELEGKPLSINKNISISTMIQEASYILTALDVCLLLQRYQITFAFLSQSRIIETNKQRKYLVSSNLENQQCAFIVIPTYKTPASFSFKLIQSEESDPVVALQEFKKHNLGKNSETVINILSTLESKTSISIDDMLRNFNKEAVVSSQHKGTKKNKVGSKNTTQKNNNL